jgi:hypothetical protein
MYESVQPPAQLACPCGSTRGPETDLPGTGQLVEADRDNDLCEFDPSLAGRRLSFEFPYPGGYVDVLNSSHRRVPFESHSNSEESGTCRA